MASLIAVSFIVNITTIIAIQSNHGSNHGSQQKRSSLNGITTQDQRNELTRIQAHLRYHMSYLIGKFGQDLLKKKREHYLKTIQMYPELLLKTS